MDFNTEPDFDQLLHEEQLERDDRSPSRIADDPEEMERLIARDRARYGAR